MTTKNNKHLHMKLYKYFLSTALGTILLIGCTDRFEDINANDYKISDEVLQQDFNHIKALLPSLFYNVYQINPAWGYQIQTGLQGDIWSGYMATPTPFAGNINNSHYALVNGWNGYAWDVFYNNIMPNSYKIESQSKIQYQQFYAMSLVLKVAAAHKIADAYGPMIYSNFGKSDATIPYDSVEEVYNIFFEELDIAISIFKNLASNGAASTIASSDKSLYNGSYALWGKYANSLRLRLAMRMVKANPNRAKQEAEKAINSTVGLITSSNENFVVLNPNSKHPINTISNSWNDIRMGADMESIMNGFEDPRRATYFKTSQTFPGQYRGVRSGIDITSKNDRVGMSAIGAIVDRNELVLFNASETHFLLAEAALRNWNTSGISAQSAYENGISASFTQHNVSGVADYKNDNAKTAQNFVDTVNPLNNASAVNSVTIKWNETASNEEKLQKIITQKWIAMFPDGQEAWSEWRRTGYPKLFPIVRNMSNGVIPTSLGVRRLNFPLSEYDTNASGVTTGVTKLGGADNGATRLWWDKNMPNF